MGKRWKWQVLHIQSIHLGYKKKKEAKAEISYYVFIIQLSAHKRTTEMVGYVLGKLLQKYKLDKLSQVIFHTVELTELFSRTVFIWTGSIVRTLYTFFSLSGAQIKFHQLIFAWLFGIAASFWMVSSGSVSLADHEDVPYHCTAFCPVIWAGKSSALYALLGKNPRNSRPNSSLV